MKNDDYKVEFENNRKEIDLERDGNESLPSRAERHGRKRKRNKASSHTMINVILGVFTFIPILIFVYVIYNFYFGSDNGSAKVDNAVVPVEVGLNDSIGKNDGSGTSVVASEEDEDENSSEGNAESDNDKDNATDTKKPAVNVNPPVVEKKNPPVVEKKDPPKKEEIQKPAKTPAAESGKKTHIVAANETLYRISMNYYGSDAGIEKIKKANGLSTNEIMAGQKLIIP